MAFIGSLVTTVKANTSQFKKKMKGARDIAKNFGRTLKKIGVGVAKFGVALGVVAVGALIAFTAKAFKAIDATAKLARELEIGTAALVGYQLAAGLSGVTTETLNKALSRMARTVGEARSGITTGTKALDDFGIELDVLKGLTTQQIFEKFADEIAKIPDPMERAAKASLIFGRAGGKLLNFLSLGSVGLAKVKDEVDALGISFNEVDAAKVEEANDAILKMTTLTQGLGNTIAITVAPALTKIVTRVTDFVKEAGGIDKIVKKQMISLRDVMIDIADVFQLAKIVANAFTLTLKLGIALVSVPLAGLVEGVSELLRLMGADIPKGGFFSNFAAENLEQIKQDIKDIEKAADDFKKGISTGELRNFFNELSEDAQKSKDVFEKFFDSAIEKSKEFNETLREQKEIQEENRKEHEKVIAAAMRIFEETRTPLEKVEAEIKKILELMGKGLDDELEEGLERKLKKLKEEREKILAEKEIRKAPLQEAIEEIKEKVKDILPDIEEKEPIGPGGFKVLDLDNISLEGVDRAMNVNQKQLSEAKKHTNLLQGILDTNKQFSNVGAVAV